MRICSTDGCNKKHWAKGLCQKHYNAAHRIKLCLDPIFKPRESARTSAYVKKRRRTDPEYRIRQDARTAERYQIDPAYHARKNSCVIARRAERLKTNTFYKFTHNVRGLINHAFKNGGFSKNSKATKILGCSFKHAMKHIGWFPGCEIHHIIFMENAKTEEDAIRLNHYTNLIAVTPERHKEIHKNILEFNTPNGTRITIRADGNFKVTPHVQLSIASLTFWKVVAALAPLMSSMQYQNGLDRAFERTGTYTIRKIHQMLVENNVVAAKHFSAAVLLGVNEDVKIE